MLYAFLVRFTPASGVDIRKLTGFRLASALLEVIERYAPELSAHLHEGSRWPKGLKPYTVSSAEWVAGQTMEQGLSGHRLAQFRMTLLEDSLLGPVLSAISQFGSEFRPFEQAGAIDHFNMDQTRGRWTGVSDSKSLLANAPDDPSPTILLASPTAFRSTGRRGYVHELIPELFVSSLLGKWEAYGRVPLDGRTCRRLRDDLIIKESHVCVERVAAGRRLVAGLMGRVQFEAPNPSTGKLLQTLLAFAFYSGIGVKTAEGMGQVLPLHHAVAD